MICDKCKTKMKVGSATCLETNYRCPKCGERRTVKDIHRQMA